MTKVEEEYNNCIFALILAQKGADEGVVNAEMYKALNSLITAVRDEERIGKLELHLMFPNLPKWTWVERLKTAILAGHETTENVDNLISAAIACGRSEGVAEGAEQEGERIRKGSKHLYCWENDESNDASFWHVPASILATKESEK